MKKITEIDDAEIEELKKIIDKMDDVVTDEMHERLMQRIELYEAGKK